MKKKALVALLLLFALLISSVQVSFANQDTFIVYNSDPAIPDSGAADFSWLNEKPAGTHGAVLTKGDDFVFEDGTPVKFFGVNIGFGAAFPTKSVAESMAANLSALGANMVRIHATDMIYSSFIDYSAETTQTFSAEMLDRLDYLIYCLKEEGIYIHFDMAAGRIFYEGDGFTAEEAEEMQNRVLRGFLFYNDTASALIRKYIVDVLSHVNPYTGMSYAEDPAIAIIQYSNETSVTWVDSWQNGNILQDSLDEKWQDFLIEKYKTDENLRAAWTNVNGVCALRKSESLELRNVSRIPLLSWEELTISPLPTTIYASSDMRHADYAEFLIEVETDAFQAAYAAIRATGYKGAINCSNYSQGPVDAYINSFGDVCERTAYLGGGTVTPTYFPYTPLVTQQPDSDEGHFISKAQNGVVDDKPFFVAEYNVLLPMAYNADTVLQAATYGCLQDWDGLMLFCYTFEGSEAYFQNKGLDNFYGSYNDPAIIASFGIASAIFRLGLVKEAENDVDIAFSYDDILANNAMYNYLASAGIFVSRFSNAFFDEKYTADADLVITSGNTSSGDYSDAEKLFVHSGNLCGDAYQKTTAREEWLAGYVPEVKRYYENGEFLVAAGEDAIVDRSTARRGLLDTQSPDVTLQFVMQNLDIMSDGRGFHSDKTVSDTGEIILKRNGSLYVDADRITFFSGNTEEGINTPAFSVQTQNDMAAVALFEKDEDSQLLYALGRTKNSNMIWNEGTLEDLGTGPILAEDIRGRIEIYSSREKLTVYGLDEHGNRASELDVETTASGFEFDLGTYVRYELIFAGNRAANTLKSIKITNMPDKLVYNVCEPLDISGMSVVGVYESGEERKLEFYDVDGFEPQLTGKQQIEVSFEGQTAFFEAQVCGYADGDADGDGEVTIKDAMLALGHVAGKAVLEGAGYNSCDMDENGRISLSDTIRLFGTVAGKNYSF